MRFTISSVLTKEKEKEREREGGLGWCTVHVRFLAKRLFVVGGGTTRTPVSVRACESDED